MGGECGEREEGTARSLKGLARGAHRGLGAAQRRPCVSIMDTLEQPRAVSASTQPTATAGAKALPPLATLRVTSCHPRAEGLVPTSTQLAWPCLHLPLGHLLRTRSSHPGAPPGGEGGHHLPCTCCRECGSCIPGPPPLGPPLGSQTSLA